MTSKELHELIVWVGNATGTMEMEYSEYDRKVHLLCYEAREMLRERQLSPGGIDPTKEVYHA